ncbi:hypothetical protein [Clostridium sp. JNZ J1-5]
MYPYDYYLIPSQFFYRQLPPGGGPPFGPPGMPPSGAPGGGAGGPSGRPPMGPPPSFTPSKAQTKAQPGVKAVDPGSIRRCMFRYVYIWLDNGRSFWAWVTYVGRRSLSGYRWMGYRWVYFGIDLRRIDSFICY